MLSMFIVFTSLKLLGYIIWPWYIVCLPLYYLIIEIIVGLLILAWVYKKYLSIYKKNRKELPDLSPAIETLKNIGKKNDKSN